MSFVTFININKASATTEYSVTNQTVVINHNLHTVLHHIVPPRLPSSGRQIWKENRRCEKWRGVLCFKGLRIGLVPLFLTSNTKRAGSFQILKTISA